MLQLFRLKAGQTEPGKAGVEDVLARVESNLAGPREQSCNASSIWPFSKGGLLLSWRYATGRAATVMSPSDYIQVDNRRLAYLRSLFGQFSVDENDVDARSLMAFSSHISSYRGSQ